MIILNDAINSIGNIENLNKNNNLGNLQCENINCYKIENELYLFSGLRYSDSMLVYTSKDMFKLDIPLDNRSIVTIDDLKIVRNPLEYTLYKYNGKNEIIHPISGQHCISIIGSVDWLSHNFGTMSEISNGNVNFLNNEINNLFRETYPKYNREPLMVKLMVYNLLNSLKLSMRNSSLETMVINSINGGMESGNFNYSYIVCDKFNISRNQLNSMFIKKYGMNFTEYSDSKRMQKAKLLLKSGFSSSEVANQLGYLSREGFSRAFKRIMNMSPKDIKRNE
ncbi:helix-turn-helix domain-containing protein [Vibrio vulnificus]|uniref:helix-turn-helix domain-containing protein n=1 Tax=Vibrio vulnificus TaxID=672 RepID=UPI0013EE5285|nr:AraC family transcriptional regulator [Vibrio vulnificus]